jgi:hypothetical protein
MTTNTAPSLAVNTAKFDGINDYVDLSNITMGSTFTIEAWVNINTYTDYSRIIEMATAGSVNNNNIAMGFYGTTHQPYIGVMDSTTNALIPAVRYIVAPSVLSTGAWHHVAGVFNGISGTVYVDGIAVVSGTFSVPSADGVRDDVWIGRSHHAVSNFTEGAILDLRIWSDVRTASEISDNMNPADLTDTTGLLARYPLESSAAQSTLATLGNGTAQGGLAFGQVSSFLPIHYTENGAAIPLNRELVIADLEDQCH